MPTHAEIRPVAYSADQMFALVADVDRYPEFLPWCRAARIRRRDGDVFWADLAIGFKFVRESFTSKVTLEPDRQRILVEYIDGPFKYLKNSWEFRPLDGAGSEIDFYVDFEFRSRMLQRMMSALFGEAVRRMVAAFESRAADLYD